MSFIRPAGTFWKGVPAVPAESVPAGSLSIWQPIHLGIDEAGVPVRVSFIERNLLLGGETGGGKSGALNLVVGHAALSVGCRLVLLDGKRVELGFWRKSADIFVGPDINAAIEALDLVVVEMDRRYDDLLEIREERKLRPGWVGFEPILVACDEMAYFSATVGTKTQQGLFTAKLRDVVARGRAAGIITVGATQRPTAEVISPSLRDLFAYRWAFRCPTDASSDVILGHGWASRGYTATDVNPAARGAGWLLAEGDLLPRRAKSAFLTDPQTKRLARHAAAMRAQYAPAPLWGIAA